jgi:hypothetical protein
LIDEYRRASGGKSFYIISFAELLELFGASIEVVKEVRQEEVIVSLEASTLAHTHLMNRGMDAEQAVFRWLTQSIPANRIIVSRGIGPDFRVIDSSGVDLVGYEVKYIEKPYAILSRLRHIEERLLHRLPPHVRQAYIVCVAANVEMLEPLKQVMRTRGVHYPLLGTIVGSIDGDGVFREVLRIDPPASSAAPDPGDFAGR